LIVDNLSQLISVLFINFAEALAVKLHKKRAPCVPAQGANKFKFNYKIKAMLELILIVFALVFIIRALTKFAEVVKK